MNATAWWNRAAGVRRRLAVVLAAGAVASVAGAPPGARTMPEDAQVVEVVEAPYALPAAGAVVWTLEAYAWAEDCGDPAGGCVAVQAPSGSEWAVVEVIDDLSSRPLAHVDAPKAWLCGGRSEPLATRPGAVMAVTIVNGECDGQPAPATSGTVRITFFGLPA